MDKIYSRKRIRLPKVIYGGNQRKIDKILKISIILGIAILVMVNMLNAINPIFESVCIDTANSLVNLEVNSITTSTVEKYQDSELISITQNENGDIQLLQVNSKPLNSLVSEITNDIQESLNDNDKATTYIPFGSITGIKWLSGFGPKISIKIALSGTIQTTIRNEFDDAGINQTVHRLWLDVTCNINILTPYEVISTQVVNEIVLSENVIIGGVPDVYMNVEE